MVMCMNGWTMKWRGIRRWSDGWVGIWKDRWVDGYTDGQVDEWMDG